MTDNNKIYFNDMVQDFEITSRFGERVDPIWKKDFIEKNGITEYNKLDDSKKTKKFHNGIDLISDTSLLIKAYKDNLKVITIEEDETQNAAGKYIYVKDEDNNIIVAFCHLNQIKVKLNQNLKKGDIVGIMGKTGRATGIHLHLLIKDLKTKNYINPEEIFLKKAV